MGEAKEWVQNGIRRLYYERITGEKFVKAEEADLHQRIAKNVAECLAKL